MTQNLRSNQSNSRAIGIVLKATDFIMDSRVIFLHAHVNPSMLQRMIPLIMNTEINIGTDGAMKMAMKLKIIEQPIVMHCHLLRVPPRMILRHAKIPKVTGTRLARITQMPIKMNFNMRVIQRVSTFTYHNLINSAF